MSLKNNIMETIESENLIKPNDSILVALSGGPDSVALLHLLIELSKKLNITLSAVYINHNLRPKAVKKEEVFVRRLCEKYNLELFVISENIRKLAKSDKKGIEETARDFRYGVFENLANEYEFDKVALGHHLDDQAETILFRIIRGTGRTGLAGMRYKRDIYIRPLLDCTKNEILDYLQSNKFDYCLDRSNLDPKFTRNFIRHKLIPYLKKNLNPAVEKSLTNLAKTTADEEDYLQKIVRKTVKKTVSFSAGGKIQLDVEQLKSYDKWLRRRILRYCLTEASKSDRIPDSDVVERLEKTGLTMEKAVSLPGDINAILIDTKLVFYNNLKANFNLEIKIGQTCELPSLNCKLKSKIKKASEINKVTQRRSMKTQMDFSNIHPPLSIRTIKPGDRFCPLGMKGTKKVGDYLTDKKIEKIFRDEIPVLVDQKGIIWLAGFEIDNRTKINKNTEEVLEIELTKIKR